MKIILQSSFKNGGSNYFFYTCNDLMKCSYFSTNMAEATVIGMIQDLEILHRTGSNDRAFIGIKIKELNEMLDFLREFSMEERSRLKYLTADLVELAQDVMDEKFRVMTREALI